MIEETEYDAIEGKSIEDFKNVAISIIEAFAKSDKAKTLVGEIVEAESDGKLESDGKQDTQGNPRKELHLPIINTFRKSHTYLEQVNHSKNFVQYFYPEQLCVRKEAISLCTWIQYYICSQLPSESRDNVKKILPADARKEWIDGPNKPEQEFIIQLLCKERIDLFPEFMVSKIEYNILCNRI